MRSCKHDETVYHHIGNLSVGLRGVLEHATDDRRPHTVGYDDDLLVAASLVLRANELIEEQRVVNKVAVAVT